MTYRIWIEHARRRELAVVTGRANGDTIGREIRARFDELYAHLNATPGATTGRNIVMYHDGTQSADVFRADREIPIDVGVECILPADASSGLRVSRTPEGLVATTEHIGPYHRLPEAHEAIRSWCNANGWELAGLSWEVYGRWSDDPEQRCTGVYYLLR